MSSKEYPIETLNGKPFKLKPVKIPHSFYTTPEFNVSVEKDHSCQECMHRKVCAFDMRRNCMNYIFGRSGPNVKIDSCDSCTHRFTRYDKDPIPCFKCRFFNLIQPECPNCGAELKVHVKYHKKHEYITDLWLDCDCGYKIVEIGP
jgi:hypothetical protein